MTRLFTLLLFLLPTLCASVAAFHRSHTVLFGVRGGAESKTEEAADEHQRAAAAILSSIIKAEKAVLRAVESEIDALFHKDPEHHQKEDVKVKAKKVVEKATTKVKEDLHSDEEKTKLTHYPYAWPNPGPEHEAEIRILEAIESAEKAVLHAVEQEVGTIFHELEHHEDKKVAKQAEKVVKQSVKKATEKAEETAKHRREWLADSKSSIEEYLCMDFE